MHRCVEIVDRNYVVNDCDHVETVHIVEDYVCIAGLLL